MHCTYTAAVALPSVMEISDFPLEQLLAFPRRAGLYLCDLPLSVTASAPPAMLSFRSCANLVLAHQAARL